MPWRRGREVLILEREDSGTGISARNSEVIHAGIYPSGARSRQVWRVAGRESTVSVLRRARRRTIGAAASSSLPRGEHQHAQLGHIAGTARASRVADLEWLAADAARARARHSMHGGAALPATGIIDSHGLMLALLGDAGTQCSQKLLAAAPVRGGRVEPGPVIETSTGTCGRVWANPWSIGAGLGARRRWRGGLRGCLPQSVPRRRTTPSNYYSLAGRSPFSRLIYPCRRRRGLGSTHARSSADRRALAPDVEWIRPSIT